MMGAAIRVMAQEMSVEDVLAAGRAKSSAGGKNQPPVKVRTDSFDLRLRQYKLNGHILIVVSGA